MKEIQFLTIALLLVSALLLSISGATAQSANTNSMVRLVYFLPNDRPARPERVTALRQTIKDAQAFYADEMERHGYGRKTFTVETDKDGEPVVHQVYGKFNENYYYNRFTGLEVWKEFFEHADDLQHIYFFAIDLSNDMLSSGNTCGTGGVNYFSQSADNVPNVVGPGPLAMRYSNETQGEEVLGGAVAIPASGSCYERIGLTLHELGHAFGLQHDFREGINNGYVMSYAHTKKRLSECAAEWLSVSRFFNSNPKLSNSPGSIQLISKPRYSSDGISIRFKVTDADGLHQAQLLGAEMTEQGSWKDDKLFDCKQLNGKTRTIEFISQTLTIEPVDNIMLQIIDVNGNITWATFLVDIASELPPPEIVSIPDPNLATALRKELALAPGAPITNWEMRRLRNLQYLGPDLGEDQKISNLTGLEAATNLEVLNLYANQIRDISPLEGLQKLKRLWLPNNQIRNISSLTKLTNLRWLYIEENEISDVRPLTRLTKLEELYLQGNPIKDREPLLAMLRRNPDIKIYLKEGGDPLPVSLSRFRAELTDAGIVLKWTTESELDNAGFNIHRSETKNGEFKIVNPQLIQGAGTTTERHTYTWTDTTAKPNVVYYYQIEDISHAGDRKQLATIRLRGLVSATGKLTTSWADLKTSR